MEKVLKRFAHLAGLSEEAAAQWQELCGDAYVLLESQRKERSNQSRGDLVCAAAAALAFYQYTLQQNAAQEPDFTAGDIKITHNGKSVERAREFWEQARRNAAPLLQDSEFCFWEMKL